MNTRFDLEYRDASNYKASASVVVDGEITQEMINQIGQNLEDGTDIIADQVGLPTPAEQLHSEFGGPSEDDHVYTTLEQWEDEEPVVADFLTDEPATFHMSIEELCQMISSAEWDVGKEMLRQDIPA